MYPETMFVLRLFTPLAELRERYLSQVEKHHQKVASEYPDAGFDLFVLETTFSSRVKKN